MVYALASINILGFIVWSYFPLFFNTVYSILFVFFSYSIIILPLVGFFIDLKSSTFQLRFIKLVIFVICSIFVYCLIYSYATKVGFVNQEISFFGHFNNHFFVLSPSDVSDSTVNLSPVPNTTVSARVSVSVPQETAGHIWNAINSSNIGNAIVVSSSVTAGGVIASSVAGTPLAKIGTFMGISAGGTLLGQLSKSISKMEEGSGGGFMRGLKGAGGPELPYRPGSPGNGGFSFAPSGGGLDDSEVWWSFLFRNLPEWVTQDLAQRVPTTPGPVFGHYNLLFLQYNLIVYLMVVIVIFVVVAYFNIGLLKLMRSYRTYLMDNFPKTIGRFASSHSLTILIKLYWISIFVNYWNIFQCILFMYTHFIPNDIGIICDTAIMEPISPAVEIQNK